MDALDIANMTDDQLLEQINNILNNLVIYLEHNCDNIVLVISDDSSLFYIELDPYNGKISYTDLDRLLYLHNLTDEMDKINYSVLSKLLFIGEIYNYVLNDEAYGNVELDNIILSAVKIFKSFENDLDYFTFNPKKQKLSHMWQLVHPYSGIVELSISDMLMRDNLSDALIINNDFPFEI